MPSQNEEVTTIELTEGAMVLARRMNDAIHEADYPIPVARMVRRMNELLTQLAMRCVEDGIIDGLSQKQLADALGVPPRALAGAIREFRR